MPSPRDLSGRVAVVAGATRREAQGEASRGCWVKQVRSSIARDAAVVCSRTRRIMSNAGRPETIEETAEMVTAGGRNGHSLARGPYGR